MPTARLGALPDPPQASTIQLPGGATLTGMVEMPRGVSESCRVNFNLLLQLGPILGSLHCLMALFRFAGWLIDFVKAVPDVPTNPTKLLQKLEELQPIADDLLGCITAYTPLGICPPIKDALKVVRDYLRCLVEVIESVATQKVGLQVQMGEAEGNPQLRETLQLAQDNADKVGLQAMRSCEPAFGVLQTMSGLLQMLGAGAIELPSMDDLAGGEIGEAIQPLKDVVEILDLTIDALPC
jgi:hypothetical protein